MSFNLSILSFELKNIGSIPRRRIDSPNLLYKSNVISNNHQVICLDDNGEYTLLNEMLGDFQMNYQAFYDGEQKVIEVFYDNGNLLLKILTTKQTNVFVDLTVDHCVIKAVGPLCIDSKLIIKSSLLISAEALCLLDTIDFDGSVSLTIQQGVGFLAALRSKKLNISAAYLYQSSDLRIEQYDVSVQALQQMYGAKTYAKKLRLVSEQCAIVGEFCVQESCFLTANNLLIGDGKFITTVEVPTTHYIHIINGLVRRKSTIVVGQILATESNVYTHTTQWIVDESFFIDKKSYITFYNTQLDVNNLESRGILLLNNCSSTIKHSIIHQGSFELSHSHLLGDKVSVFSGSVIISKQSAMNLAESLTADHNVHLVIKNSYVRAVNNVLLLGTATISRSRVNADNFSAHQSIILKNTQVTTNKFVELQGNVNLKKVSLKSQEVLFVGDLDVDHVKINSTTVNYQCQQGYFSQNFVVAKNLFLSGGDVKGNMTLTNSRLIFNIVTIKNYVMVQKTDLVAVEDANICHNIEGKLTLNNSQFITDSQLYSMKGSHIELCEYSNILSSNIDSQGSLSAQNSSINCEGLFQKGASLNLNSSSINVNTKFEAHNSDLTLESDSRLLAANVLLRQNSNMRLTGVSILAARERIIIDAGSTLSSNNSMTSVHKFSSLGRVELCASLLSAEELHIYSQFSAQDETVIQIEDLILVEKNSQVNLTSSYISGHAIETFGELNVINSTIRADKTISFMSTSTTTLQERTSVIADDARLSGRLITQSLENMKSTSKPILQLRTQLDISPSGIITGNEDVVINADVINQSGQIALSGSLSAKGRQFNNFSSVMAGSMYLGFDDMVINHGIFSAKSMTFHSNFMNILGQVYATEVLSCAGLINLNMGLVAVNNHLNDSFFSLNAGLIVPNISADYKYIFSLSNIATTAKTAAMMTMPLHTNGIQLFSMVPGLFSTATNLYQLSNKLDWNTLQNMRRHEYMPILCQIKNTCMLGRGLFTATNAFGGELSAWNSSFTKMIHEPVAWSSDWNKTLQVTDWKEMGLRAVGTFGGSYTDSSLLHVNSGASFVGNTSKTNFIHLNTGSEKSLFSHNINTNMLFNQGVSSGREAAFAAKFINNNGSLLGSSQLTVRANKVDNNFIIRGSHANVSIDEMHQNGILKIDNGSLKVKSFTDTNTSDTDLTSVILKGKTLKQEGKFTLNNVYIQEDESVTTGVHAKLATNNVNIETKLFTHNGQIEYENSLTLNADTVVFANGSSTGGKKTSDEQLFVLKDESVPNADVKENNPADSGQKETKPEKEFKPQHVLSILAKKATLNGKLSGGDYTQIQGKNTESKEIDTCDEVTIGDTAVIDLKYGAMTVKKSSISGATSLDSFQLKINESVLNQDGVLILHNTNYTGDSFDSSGVLILNNTHLDISSIHLSKNASEQC